MKDIICRGIYYLFEGISSSSRQGKTKIRMNTFTPTIALLSEAARISYSEIHNLYLQDWKYQGKA
jgi:hypothetical protein